jgi:hypothetical protein
MPGPAPTSPAPGTRESRSGVRPLCAPQASVTSTQRTRPPRTRTRRAAGDSCFLAKEQSWRTAWHAHSLLSRTITSSGRHPTRGETHAAPLISGRLHRPRSSHLPGTSRERPATSCSRARFPRNAIANEGGDGRRCSESRSRSIRTRDPCRVLIRPTSARYVRDMSSLSTRHVTRAIAGLSERVRVLRTPV